VSATRDHHRLKLEDYRARLKTEPLTVNQLGRIRREFERLGFAEADRAERLRITSQLAQVPGELATTNDLTMGQAGQVIRILTSCRSTWDLHAAADPGWTARVRAGTWARIIRVLAASASQDN
jgi:hypothetical protein